jgi:alpha-N-arabinofuranosidase
MKVKIITAILAVAFLFSGILLSAQENIVTLQPSKATMVINKNLYSHFAEHLGHCIYEGIWVGEKSTIPNVRGIRTDVVSALRDMGIPALRWPGGCFADEYHWKNGVGPRDKRPTMINTNWGGVTEDNSFGTNEFLDLCEQLGCEPVITGNVGSGSVEEMSQWVEYVNSDNISPMTDLRKANGHEKAWKVKYWGIGNESWGCGGAMSPEFYFDQLMRYSNFARNYGDNQLYRIAVGANVDDYRWTETIMKLWSQKSPWEQRLMNGLSLHYYTLCHGWDDKGSATVFTEKDWFSTLKQTCHIDELINKHLAIMDKYDPEHKIGLVVDEWGNWFWVEPGTNPGFLFQQNTLRDAMVAGINLNIFNNHADRIVMANIAQMINVLQSMILTKKEQMVLTPTYYVFKMYKVHQGATQIPVAVTCRDYTVEGESIPSINVSASKDASGKIHITLVNLDPNTENPVTLNLGLAQNISVTGEVVTSKNMNDYNDFGQAPKVVSAKFDKFKAGNGQLQVTMPSKSVVCLEIAQK